MKVQLFGNKVIRQTCSRGVSTLELLIAFALLTLSLSSVVLVFFSNQTVSVDAEARLHALRTAEAQLESARASAHADFNLVNPTSSAYVEGSQTYHTTLSVSQIDLFTKQATSTVSWQSGSRTLTSELTTLLTNTAAANGSDTTCSSVVVGDWKQPQHHEWDLGQLGVNGGDGTGFGISNIAVFNKKIYITTYTSPATFKDTLFIFDAGSIPGSAPVFRGSIDNDAVSSVGPNALAIASTTNKIYAYLASPSSFSKGQLQVVDVTDASKPVVIKIFKIPTSAVPSSGTPFTLFYNNGYLYLGLSKITGGGDEFNVIDVGGGTGSPTNPIWKGGYNAGSAVNDIYVKNNYAYLATPSNENLTILDVSNPALPVHIGGYTPPTLPDSNGVGSNHGEVVMVVGTSIYLGRTYGTNEFYIVNASTPSDLLAAGSADAGSGNQPSIYGLAVRDNLAFFITNTLFEVWDISNPSNSHPYTADGTTKTFLPLTALGGTGTAMDCEDNSFYIAVASGQGSTKDILSVISSGP